MGLTVLALDVANPAAPDQRGAAPVIFGEPGDANLLGAVSLESMGFVLDAIRRDLVPLPMLIADAPRG